MSRALVLACVVVGTTADRWQAFRTKFGKQYNGNGEEFNRYKIFEENMKFVDDEDAKNLTYKLSWNQFSDMTHAEFEATMLNRWRKPIQLDVPVLGEHFAVEGDVLATTVDWSSTSAVTPVKDQGSCGGCWSFAATGALEGALFVATKESVSLSEQQFLDCDTYDGGCNGGLEYNGWNYFKDQNKPICTEASYPYEGKNKVCRSATNCVVGIAAGAISGVVKVGHTANDLKSALTKNPVAIGIEASGTAFQYYSSGVLTGTCGRNLDHSVLVVGYSGNTFWRVKNSWGADWGDNGYVKLEMGSNKCGILDDASYPTLSLHVTV